MFSSEKIPLNFIRHISINDNPTTIDLYSSQLTLSTTKDSNGILFLNELNRTIYFEQLNKLILISQNFNFNQMIKLLKILPNIQILSLSIYSSCLSSGEENIPQIISRGQLTYTDVQQLINLTPKLKSIEMNIKEKDLELIIRFLLKWKINQNHQLYLIGLRDSHSAIINRLKKVIDREELINIYSIESLSDTLYLWL